MYRLQRHLCMFTVTQQKPARAIHIIFMEVMKDYEHLPSRKAKHDELKENPYYNALQIKFAYAITCHKAQGGQWDAVFVDQGYLTEEMVNTDFLRWLYTACTRAPKELYFVPFNAPFYL